MAIRERQLNSTNYPFTFLMTDATDHVTGKTGLTVTVTLSKNGGAFASAAAAVSEIGNGWYTLAGNATDRNTIGSLILHASATGADPTDEKYTIVQYDPFAIFDTGNAAILTAAYDAAKTAASQTSVNNVPGLVWDEILTGATHNIATSAGKRLRQLASNIIYSGTVVSSTENIVKLDNGAASVDGAYDPAMLVIISGAGIGQCRGIYQYAGSTRQAVVDRDFKTIPSSGDEYMILAWPGREEVNEGLIQSATTNTVTLNTLASASDGSYVGQLVFLRSGLGEDQVRLVTAYNGTTKVATVSEDWDVIPDATTAYVMLPNKVNLPSENAAAVWSYATRTLSNFGTLVSDIWTYITRTLTSGGGSSAADVWAYASRTLTSRAPQVMDAVDDSGKITLYNYSTQTGTLTLATDITGFTKVWLTMKTSSNLFDEESTVQILLSDPADPADGLQYINGTKATYPEDGALVAIDGTHLQYTLKGRSMKLDPVNGGYDVKAEIGGEPIPVSEGGEFVILSVLTKAE